MFVSQRDKRLRWDRHFLHIAGQHALMSKDPSTKVGAVIVGPDRETLVSGFNGFPRGVQDHPRRLQDRELKNKIVVHAEMNAVLTAARIGIPLKGCRLYLAATNGDGSVWGGPPCHRCTVEIIQTGIIEIVSWPMKNAPSRWHESLELSRQLLAEAGINYREVSTEEDDHE